MRNMGEEMEACTECFQKCVLIHRKAPYRSQLVSSFFKVMYGEKFSNFLIVPPRFATTLSSLGGENTYLEDSSGQQWNVVLSKVNGSLAFLKGWHKFSLDHGIELGDFVIFHYIKGSHFFVQIYGRSGCEKLNFYGEKVYHNKRLKTTSDFVAGNGHCDSSSEEPPVLDYSTACAVSQPYVDVIQGQNDPNDVENSQLVERNVPRLEDITGKTKIAPTTDFPVDLCFITNRDTSFGREDENRYLNDLSVFEMPAKEMVADKNCNFQLQKNINSQVSTMLLKEETGAASYDVSHCHMTKENVSAKIEEAFLTREHPSLLCSHPRADMPLDSKILKNPVPIPNNSGVLSMTGGRTRQVKQEPQDYSLNFGGNAEADTSIGVNLMVKTDGRSNIIVKSESVDLCDLSAAPVIKVTCVVQPDSESSLELPERLPIKVRTRGGRLKKLVLLHDPARRLWPVVYHQRYNLKALAAGWNSFKKANNLHAGDQITFAVENLEEGIFAVHISRS